MYEYAYWIALLPALSFPINLAKKFREPVPGVIGIILTLVSWIWSMAVLFQTFSRPEAVPAGSMQWVPGIFLSAHIDPMTAMMLVVVTTVSLLVQIYSLGYMHGDPRFNRFYAFLGLFSAAMLGLVLADNFLLLLISWELVGVSSYLLIGFWFEKPSAMRAAKKAFVVTRLGDMGLLIGVILLYSQFGTFRFDEIFARLPEATPFIVGAAAMLLFLGAIGKSAQFPLHVWLPDAMEGPTPVSALIHAATMVAAGVYLTGRAFPLFEYGSLHTFSWFGLGVTPLGFVRFIGVCTLFIAATIAVAQNDIKRVLAYSTVSQLGYMMLGIGTGAWVAGLFHLMTHAFFKALLFLGSGSVIHGSGTQDMREMGGLRRTMPITFWTYVVGYLALAGFPLFAGFFSKDAILDGAFFLGQAGVPLYFWFAVFGAFLTAFYMTRQMVMVFGGTETRNPSLHVHESPWTMWLPLAILAVPSFIIGWVGLPANNQIRHFLDPAAAQHASLSGKLSQADTHAPAMPDHSPITALPGAHAAAAVPSYFEGVDLHAAGVDPALAVIYGEQHHGPGLFGTGLNPFVTAVGTLMGVLGILFGWLVYGAARKRSEPVAEQYARAQGLAAGHGHHAHDEHNHGAVADADPAGFWQEPLQRPMGPVYTFLANKWYFDEFYWKTLVEPTMAFSRLMSWVDKWIVDMVVNGVGQIGLWLSIAGRWWDNKIVDGIVNGLGAISQFAGRTMRYVQTGRVQNYAVVVFLGALFLVAVGLWLPR